MPPLRTLRMFKRNAQIKEPVRLPLQELIKQGKLPNFGERFRLAQLPEMSRNVFKRISQIYGIPVYELMPAHIRRREQKTSGGTFQNEIYGIHFSARTRKLVVGHEVLHAAQMVMGGMIYPPKNAQTPAQIMKLKKENQFMKIFVTRKLGHTRRAMLKELSVAVPQEGALRGREDAARSAISVPDRWFFWKLPIEAQRRLKGVIGAAYGRAFLSLPARYLENYYERHGADGLILLYAAPPKETTMPFVNRWESEMIKQGYLEGKGGLTKKGIWLLRRIRPRERILLELNQSRRWLEPELMESELKRRSEQERAETAAAKEKAVARRRASAKKQ